MSDITLPTELVTYGFSLDVIGAIFTIYSFPNLSEDEKAFWAKDENFSRIIEDLIEAGYLKINTDDDKEVSAQFDFSSLSKTPPFWDLYDYDKDDNEILSHNSHYGDEGSPFQYLLYRSLKSNKLVYSLHHSELGEVEDYIDTIEEAEAIVREELAQELISIEAENY